MQKVITAFLLCCIFTQSFGQKQCKISTYFQAQYNKTIYDRTVGNNPWGMGLGLQLFFNKSSTFKLTLDLTADTYLEDDKVLRLAQDGKPIDDIRGMVNLFAGAYYNCNYWPLFNYNKSNRKLFCSSISKYWLCDCNNYLRDKND